jgi:AP endonuclease-2
VTPIAAEEGITGRSHDNGPILIGSSVRDITDEDAKSLDSEGRGLLTEHLQENGRSLVIINVYCPRVDPDNPERLPYKLDFIRTIHKRCISLQADGKDVVVCGDLNCIVDIIDSASMEDMPTFVKEPDTREILTSIISKSPPTTDEILLDSFRYMNPSVRGAFTCWCTVTSSRKLNYGQRIDYILISRQLVHFLVDSSVLQDEHGSDHCPVVTQLDINIVPSTKLPSLCSVHYAKFAGKQSKLSNFFERKNSTEHSAKDTKKCHVKKQSTLKLKKVEEKSSKGKSTQQTSDIMNHEASVKSSKTLSTEWKAIFKEPPKAPLCTGHKEPSVLRVVKKPGPNKNKKFYVCNRPDGSKNDPNGRCNFFQWCK